MGIGGCFFDAVQFEDASAVTAYNYVREAYCGANANMLVTDILAWNMDQRRNDKTVAAGTMSSAIADMLGEFWALTPGTNLLWLCHNDAATKTPNIRVNYRTRWP